MENTLEGVIGRLEQMGGNQYDVRIVRLFYRLGGIRRAEKYLHLKENDGTIQPSLFAIRTGGNGHGKMQRRNSGNEI